LKPEPELKRSIMQAVQSGLPLCLHPYRELAAQLGIEESQLLERMEEMLAEGLIRRIGVVPNHYALGYHYNLMVVWDIEDEAVASTGQRLGSLDYVSHCYRRPRKPDWPYNLFTMVHGKTAAAAEARIAEMRELVGPVCCSHTALKSTRILKKTGLRLRSED
jgi:DNA-binding Lrp family transcriptional regulator